MQIEGAGSGGHDVVETLPDRGARCDHLECPDQPGLLPGFELSSIVPGIRHECEFYANGAQGAPFLALRVL